MRRCPRPAAFATLALALVLAGAPRAEAGLAAQTFYIPLPEDQIFSALTAIFPGPGPSACNVSTEREVQDPIITYVSVAAAAEGTVIYYDHWEDGYEPDITRPVQPTTAVWGDGDPANGIPPGFAADAVGAGDILVLHNPVPVAGRRTVLDFDGGDKVAASAPVAVTRAAWASGTETRLAGAVEVHNTRDWGRLYRVPVGEDVPGTEMFEHSALMIMASKDGTRVEVDADADGSAETSVVLDQGQSHHVAGGVRTGATVTASDPIQVALVTGDVCATFQSRWFALLPTGRWSDSYFTAVSTPAADATTVHVFNPGPGAISVVRETLAGRDAGVEIAAGGVRAFSVPDGSGGHFFSEDATPFFAVGTVDTGASEHEWGFALIPEPLLTPQALLGWGAGRDPLSGVGTSENGSPAWVTPVLPAGGRGPVAICADYDGDNRGTLVDGRGYRYDRRLSLDELQRARVYDPDGDQTGMILYVCDDSGARLAVAWGQDPTRASPGAPGVDLGTTVPPLPSMAAAKDVEIVSDPDGDGVAAPGDTLRYVVTVRNISRLPVAGLLVIDQLPEHTGYVPGSTSFDAGDGPVPIPDAGATAFPLDESGGSLGVLPEGGVFTVSFLVVVDDPLPSGVTTVVNRAVVRSVTEQVEVEVGQPVAERAQHPAIAIEKSARLVAAAAGTGTIGYWKNHPEAWPVAEIAVGGLTYARDEAIALLRRPGRGDKTLDLFRQLVASRLNVLAGTEVSCIERILADADAWLAAHPPGSGVAAGSAAWAGGAAALHTALDEYNNGLLCAPHRDDAGGSSGGTMVTFTITVTNAGDVALADVQVRDPAVRVCDAFIGTLAAGAAVTYTCSGGAVTGDFVNTASVTGIPPGGLAVEASDEVLVDVPDAVPGGGATGPAGARTSGFWQARPDAWPLARLEAGGRSYGAAVARGLMRSCAPTDTSCLLFSQVAAARLNILQGLEAACVEQALVAADSWLAAHPRGSRVRLAGTAWRTAGKRLGALLQRYNRGQLCAPAAAR